MSKRRADAVEGAAAGGPKVAMFLTKLYTLCETCDPEIGAWDTDGHSFVVKSSKFADVLHNHFQSSLQTFVRQLHFYGFRKADNSKTWSFANPYFVRGRPELLVNIKRKQTRRPASKAATAASAEHDEDEDHDEEEEEEHLAHAALPAPASASASTKRSRADASASASALPPAPDSTTRIAALESQFATFSSELQAIRDLLSPLAAFVSMRQGTGQLPPASLSGAGAGPGAGAGSGMGSAMGMGSGMGANPNSNPGNGANQQPFMHAATVSMPMNMNMGMGMGMGVPMAMMPMGVMGISQMMAPPSLGGHQLSIGSQSGSQFAIHGLSHVSQIGAAIQAQQQAQHAQQQQLSAQQQQQQVQTPSPSPSPVGLGAPPSLVASQSKSTVGAKAAPPAKSLAEKEKDVYQGPGSVSAPPALGGRGASIQSDFSHFDLKDFPFEDSSSVGSLDTTDLMRELQVGFSDLEDPVAPVPVPVPASPAVPPVPPGMGVGGGGASPMPSVDLGEGLATGPTASPTLPCDAAAAAGGAGGGGVCDRGFRVPDDFVLAPGVTMPLLKQVFEVVKTTVCPREATGRAGATAEASRLRWLCHSKPHPSKLPPIESCPVGAALLPTLRAKFDGKVPDIILLRAVRQVYEIFYERTAQRKMAYPCGGGVGAASGAGAAGASDACPSAAAAAAAAAVTEAEAAGGMCPSAAASGSGSGSGVE